MMSETEPENGHDEPSQDQAIELTEATDADSIRERLPDDVENVLTKRAFSPGALRKLLRDTYYRGPIKIGSGGWRGVWGGGQPGTGLRRPNGALYGFPRSWRYAALQRGLETDLITKVGAGFVATERGAAVLALIDECPDCGIQREPYIYSSYYQGNPNTDGHLESHNLVTACPECGTDGYGEVGDSVQTSYSEYERSEDAVEFATEAISEEPDARAYGVGREVSEDAAYQVPDTDADAITDLLDRLVEEQADPRPREIFEPEDEGLYGREVITIQNDGDHYRFRGTRDAIAVSRTDDQGDIHLTLEADTVNCSDCVFRVPDGGSITPGTDCPRCEDGEMELTAHPEAPSLKVGMDFTTAVEKNAKDAVGYREGAEWNGDYWTIDTDALARAVCKLTAGFSDQTRTSGVAWRPGSDDEPEDHVEFFTVTVTEDAMEAVDSPMLGVDVDGELV